MREIKFRGKTKEGEWVYGYVDATAYKDLVVIHSVATTYTVLPDTIGQYTGLKDANGKEIYEGDLLRFPPKDQWEETNYASFEVFFHDGDCCDDHIGFQMNRAHYHGACCGTTFWPFRPAWVNKMVVDGNIHDNQELIEN